MRIFFSSFLLVSAFTAFSAWAGTFNITEDFEDYAADAFVTDSTNWTTNDQWLNNGIVTNAPTAQAGWIGGLYDSPTTPTSYLTRTFSSLDNTRFTFRWTQNIANAASDDTIRDKFGWTVKSTTGTDLLTLMFLNVNLPGQNLLAQGYSGNLLGTTVNSSNGLGVSNRGEWAQFEIVLNTTANTWSASLFNAAANSGSGAWQTFIENGAVNGSGYEVGSLSAVWDLADKTTTATNTLQDGSSVTQYTGAGANVMYVDNLSISGVPEPSSLSLLTLGSLALLAARRRRS